MPSKIIDAYRQALAQQGVTDNRSDDLVIREIGPVIQQEAPQLFEQDPDLGQLWSDVRDADAPSLPAEAGRAFKGGLQGLASTALGGASLLTGSSFLRDKAASFDKDAEANGPTIGTLEEIAPGRRGISKALSRDALRYAISKAGSVAPSIGESLLTGVAGAAIGSEIAPGPGTIIGAGAGILEKGLIKSAIRRLLAKGIAEELATKGLIEEVSEAGIQQALRKGIPQVAEAVGAEAKAVGALRGGIAANAAGSFLLNSGDVASEGADRGTSLALGLVSAIPDTILPAYVLSKLFPGVAKKEAIELGKSFLARNAQKIAEVAGIPPAEFAQEYFQEGINVVARNIKEGKDPLTFTDADLKRLREAGIAGAAGGVLATPGVVIAGREGSEVPANPETPPPPPPAFVPPARGAAQIIREASALSAEQKAARVAELTNLPSLTPEQESELELLNAGAVNKPPTTAELNAAPPTVAAPVVPPVDTSSVGGLGMIGRRVSYEGKTGVLRRLEDGTLAVDTPTQVVEILGAPKDQDFDPAAAGISLYRPVSVEGAAVKVGDDSFSLPTNPQDALNFDSNGALTSVTLTNSEGQARTIRDPEIAYEVAEKLAMRHQEQSRGADIKPPTAVELAGQTPEALWIDSWTKGFLPQTVDVSDLLDLGDSVMPDGSNVSARGEYWQMARPLEQRTLQTARANIESQISRVERSSLSKETQTDLTNELYDLLDRLERFEKERAVRTPPTPAQTFPESVAAGGAPAGASETQAAAPPVETVTAQPNERARYDEIQQQLGGMVQQAGTPAYNALQQESEDIKNRNGGMPPGEVAAEAAVLDEQLGTPPIEPAPIAPIKKSAGEKGMVARTTPALRADSDTGGTRHTEWRVRKITASDLQANESLRRERSAGEYVLERRAVRTDEGKATPGEWEVTGSGRTKKEAIEDSGETGFMSAESLDPVHADMAKAHADEVALQKSDASKKPWEIPRDRFVSNRWEATRARMNKSDGRQGLLTENSKKASESLATEHYMEVAEAVRRGENVPVDVLSDYQDLARKATPAVRGKHSDYLAAVDAVPLKGKKQELLIPVNDGEPKKVTATVYGDWAIHKALEKNQQPYSITHLPSGKVANRAANLETAQRTVKALIYSGVDAKAIPGDKVVSARAAQAILGIRSGEAPAWFAAIPKPEETALKAALSMPAVTPEAIIEKPAAEPTPAAVFEAGAVIEGAPSIDFRSSPELQNLTGQQWAQVLTESLDSGPRSDKSGNRSLTRVAVAMQAPDGRVVVSGLTVPQKTLTAAGTTAISEPALQRMGVGRAGRRAVEAGGNHPATVQDAVAAGFKPIAVLHFAGEPTKIFQSFADQAAFDSAWSATEKTQGKQIRAPQMTAQPAIARNREAEITRKIDELGNTLLRAKNQEERTQITENLKQLFAELDRVTRNEQAQTGEVTLDDAPQLRSAKQQQVQGASQTAVFQNVLANMQNLGMRVDLFAKEIFLQSAREPILQQIQQLQAALPTAQGSQRTAIEQRIAQRQSRLSELEQAAGVTYSPHHIAISLDDVQKADLGNVVTLLHEAAESLTMRLGPVAKGVVMRALDQSIAELRQQASEASQQTGVSVATTTSATDLLAETMAQKLAASGVADGQSLAQAIVRWIKDLYYRTAMAVQRGFGIEPDAKMAIDWFENQLRREVGGDFDYRLSNLMSGFQRVPMVERAANFTGQKDTPGGVADFMDPFGTTIQQPWVEPISSDAMRWNIEFRQADAPTEQNIPDPEARARIDAASVAEVAEMMKKIHEDVAREMPWVDFWKLAGRGEDPRVLLAEQATRVPGADQARIGGERMTKSMNDLATLNARILAEKIHLRQLRELERSRDVIESSSEAMVEEAKEINRIEGDMRNAALHEDTLRGKLRELAKSLVRNIRRGFDASHASGELAQAIRSAEGLMDSDPIPESYQRLLKAATEGTVPLFDSVRALAELDLPLGDMSNAEIVRAIRDNAEMSPQLQALANNKPLAVAVAELGRQNVEQMDQIQLGWLRDTTKFREILQQLEQIRSASSEEVAQMIRQMDERTKAKGLEERLKVGYLKRRRALQSQQNRIQKAEQRVAVLEKVIPPTAERVNQMQATGGGAFSEWYPVEGAKFTAMVPGADNAYTSERRELKFNPDGSAQNSDQIKRDISNNLEWLRANQERKGTRHFEAVKRQTLELAMLDIQRKYPAGWANALERMVQPIGAEARTAGHSAGARIAQMLQQFEFINRSHRDEVSAASGWWTRAFTDVENSTGIKDHGQLLSQVYDPVMYFLNVNPGLDETHAIREATRLARQLLPKPPAENFNERFATFLRRSKESSELMLKIAEQYGVYVKDPRISGALRSAVAQGWLTTPRSLRADVIQTIVRDMQTAGWKLQLKETTAPDGTPRRSVVRATTFDSLTAEDLDPQNSAVLSGALKKFFTPGIVDRWLVPFINKPGTEVFSNDGKPIPQLQVQQAWQASGGDVLRFIDNLAGDMDLEVDEESGINPLAEFRGQMLRQIDSIFAMEAKIAHESEQVRDLFDPMGPKPHAMMDARMNDLLPPEHVQFQSFDPTSSQRLLGMLAFHGAFGRNGERMVQTVNELKGVLAARKAEFESLKGTTKGARAAEAAVRGLDYKQLEAAADRYAGVLSMQDKIRGLFGVGNSAGPFHDLRGGMEVMNAMAGQIVDQPKVGAYNLLSIAMRPFAMRSLGPMTIGASVRGYSNFLTTALGSFLENLNVHLMHSSEYAKEVGSVEGQLFRNLPWGTVLADIGQRGRFQTSNTDRFLIRPLRAMRIIQRKGVKVGIGDGAREFPRLAMIPGLGVLNSISQIAAQANTMAQVQMVENIVRKGITYFNNHPTDLHDPAFRFTADKLGIGRLDTGVFDYLRNKTVEYGMGNMEDMVRAAVPEAAKGNRLLTRDQVLRLAQMAANELDGASSINTTPSVLQTNPLLKIGMPLLRWPLWMMHTVNEGLNTSDGQRSLLAMAKGLGTLALWNLPMGIAFSLMLDQYDDKILHKKANQRPIDALAAIPIVGPGLALTVGDRGWDNAMAMLERGARAGNIYGLGADVAAQVLAPYDPNSGQRSFSMDQRILVMSQFLNFQQALRNLISQGGSATWASFWRPAMMSIGGNGVLHSLDITNNLLGLDNAESRLVMRINAQNWLRAAGRETGIELRPAGASTGTAPTPMSVWTREMQLSAMANDRLGFLDSYRKALNAAREQVGADPRVSPVDREKEAASRVLSSWKSRDPLEVFRFKPTTTQLAEMYGTMNDDGRADTQEAIRRFNSFSQLITPQPFDRYVTRQTATAQKGMNPNRLRNAASSLLFSN